MRGRLQGRAALVTGPAGHREAIVLALAEQGAKPAMAARHRRRLAPFDAMLAGLGADPIVRMAGQQR
jgi:NAD(P)-dependent dehydrogenase (short-subunit alcohol dehydrogenase family)